MKLLRAAASGCLAVLFLVHPAVGAVSPVSLADLLIYFAPVSRYPATPLSSSPLRFAAGPADARALLGKPMDAIARMRPNLPSESMEVSLPLGVYSFDLAAGGMPATTKPNSYFCMVESSGSLDTYENITIYGANSPRAEFGGDSLTVAVPRALSELVALDRVKSGVYEPRILYFVNGRSAMPQPLIWLKSVSTGDDLIYLVGNGSVFGLKPKTLYTAGEFLAAYLPGMKAAANTRAAASRDPAPDAPIVFSDAPPAAVETASQRLLALQAALRTALTALRQTPASPVEGLVKESAAEVEQTLAAVDAAFTFVRAHPEADLLPTDEPRVAVPGVEQLFGAGDASRLAAMAPTCLVAINALQPGLLNFLNGPNPERWAPVRGPNPGAGGPVIGPLDGHRDEIIRHLGRATISLLGAVRTLAYSSPVAAAAVTETAAAVPPPGPPGAISGVVFDEAGERAANVLIGLIDGAKIRADAIRAYTLPTGANVTLSPAQTRISGLTEEHRQAAIEARARINPTAFYQNGAPVTLTDSHGAFTITNLPPGTYIVTANLIGARGNWRQRGSQQPIEVQAGAVTRLSVPVRLTTP